MIEGDTVQIEVPQWLADKKGIAGTLVEGEILKLTRKGLLLKMDSEEVWFPRKEITVV